MKKVIIASVVLALAGMAAQAATITYVDAVEGAAGNTFATGSTLADTSWVEFVSSPGQNANQWRKRVESYGSGGTLFQASPGNTGNNIPELTTQFTIADAGTYNIYAFAMLRPTENWNLSASLTGSPVDPADTYRFGDAGVTLANTHTYTPASDSLDLVGVANIELYAINLGQVTVGAGATQTVQIAKLVGDFDLERTWYDGVGFEAVPEPATIGLVGLFGAGMLVLRRKFMI